jgi:hypothetical protein
MAFDWHMRGSVEPMVRACPDEVYRVITDITSTGERSNECRSATWLPGGPQSAEIGARFRGRNRSHLVRWSRVCEVVEAEPGRFFAFRTVPERVDLSRADSTTWRYELVPRPATARPLGSACSVFGGQRSGAGLVSGYVTRQGGLRCETATGPGTTPLGTTVSVCPESVGNRPESS